MATRRAASPGNNEGASTVTARLTQPNCEPLERADRSLQPMADGGRRKRRARRSFAAERSSEQDGVRGACAAPDAVAGGRARARAGRSPPISHPAGRGHGHAHCMRLGSVDTLILSPGSPPTPQCRPSKHKSTKYRKNAPVPCGGRREQIARIMLANWLHTGRCTEMNLDKCPGNAHGGIFGITRGRRTPTSTTIGLISAQLGPARANLGRNRPTMPRVGPNSPQIWPLAESTLRAAWSRLWATRLAFGGLPATGRRTLAAGTGAPAQGRHISGGQRGVGDWRRPQPPTAQIQP